MATRTQARSSSTNSSRGGSTRSRQSQTSNRSAFSWGDAAAPMIGAAIAGAAFGVAANFGRKLLVQAATGIAGDWDQVLATEHDLTLAIFDKMLATDPSQSWKRGMLLMQLTHMLDKHAHEEEMVVYPALREAGQIVEADELNGEHGYIKTFLYELGQMETDDSSWLETVREFRTLVAEHARMEEEQVFPTFKRELSEDQNDKITAAMNRDGFWQA